MEIANYALRFFFFGKAKKQKQKQKHTQPTKQKTPTIAISISQIKKHVEWKVVCLLWKQKEHRKAQSISLVLGWSTALVLWESRSP